MKNVIVEAMRDFMVLLVVSVAIVAAVSGCGFNKQTLKEAKCQFDKGANKFVCEIPVPAEAVK